MKIENNILVTGAAGFIGFNFVRQFFKKYKIIALDKMTYAANDYAIDFFETNEIKFIKKDINDLTTKEIQELDIKTIINFAAETHVDNSIENPDVFIKTNINGTFNLLKIARELNIRFHQISTDEVYGDLPLDDPKAKFTTDSNINPSSPYSASKASSDMLVQAFVRTYGINATISRCSNNYGPYQNKEKLIPKTISNLDKGVSIGIYGNGKNVRDWIFVEDHNHAVEAILLNSSNGVFNVGSNNELTNNEIVEIIRDQLNASNDLIRYVEDRLGHDLRYAIDPQSMERIGWSPKTTFKEGIKKTIEHYVQK